MEQKNNSGDWIVLGTKVSTTFAATFNRICERKGLNPYRVIQMMIEAFVRYTDEQHNMSQEMELLMSVFEHMVGWNDAFNLADHTAEKQIEEAVYFLTAKNRQGARAVMVQRPFFGDWQETCNIADIFARVVQLLTPERHARLTALAEEMGCNGIIQALDTLIDEHTKEESLRQYRTPFEDASRAENNRPLEYAQRTRRVKHQTPDMFNSNKTNNGRNNH